MKVIIACLKLYDDKDYHTNGNTQSQSGNIYYSVVPVSLQTSEGDLEIIFKHAFSIYQ
jgi:hypothetical protein